MNKKLLTLIMVFALMLPALVVHGVEYKGVLVAEEVILEGSEQPIKLNGVGMRTKFFFDIYVGALYLKDTVTTTEDALSQQSPKRVFMNFLYDEVSAEKLVTGWNDGFEGNLSDEQLSALADRIKSFNAMFDTVNSGDVILLDYIPTKGTRVTIKGEVKGVIEGEDFNQALLKIWLGDEPADDGLKEAMLNADD